MRVQQCPYCEHSNPVEAKFCNDCGSPLHLKPCPACATLADSGAEACPSCGAAFPDRPILTVRTLDDPVDADDEPIVLTERIDLQDPVGLNDPIVLPEPVGLGDPIDLGDPIGLGDSDALRAPAERAAALAPTDPRAADLPADATEPATASADAGPRTPHVSLFDRIAERGLRSPPAAPPSPPPVPERPPVPEPTASAPAPPGASDESLTNPTARLPASASVTPGRRRPRLAWIAIVLVAAALVALLVNRDRGARDPTAAPPGAGAARVDVPAPVPSHDAPIVKPTASTDPAPAAPAPAAKSPAHAAGATTGAPAAAPAAAVDPAVTPASPAAAAVPNVRARGPQPATQAPPASGRVDCTRAVAALGLCDTPLPKEEE